MYIQLDQSNQDITHDSITHLCWCTVVLKLGIPTTRYSGNQICGY